MTPVIGGKLDGQTTEQKGFEFTEGNEAYVLMTFVAGEKKITRFFMVCHPSLTIIEALETYRARQMFEDLTA